MMPTAFMVSKSQVCAPKRESSARWLVLERSSTLNLEDEELVFSNLNIKANPLCHFFCQKLGDHLPTKEVLVKSAFYFKDKV